MIYGYIRVSTDKQTVENQKFEILGFAQKENLKIDRWIEETISGTKDVSERKLGVLLKKVRKNDILIVSELSRLGRNLLQIMSILHYCMRQEVKLWTIKDNYRLGSDIQSKVLAFAFGLSAEIERNLISQRTKESLSRLRSEGRRLGRPIGAVNKELRLDAKKELITQLLRERVPEVKIALRVNVHRHTLHDYIYRSIITKPNQKIKQYQKAISRKKSKK